MCVVGDLPFNKQRQREGDQDDCEWIHDVTVLSFGDDDEDERGEDHGEVPIVDAASGAAAVVHHPRLEGAEEQDADHVGDGIEQGDDH